MYRQTLLSNVPVRKLIYTVIKIRSDGAPMFFLQENYDDAQEINFSTFYLILQDNRKPFTLTTDNSGDRSSKCRVV
jgi:hypothetical protein